MKVIHNADFERAVLGRHGITLANVFDTLVASRRLHGRKIEGGHGLGVVCARELGAPLDKICQTSDWTRRPLSPEQETYASLDAEVLLGLYEAFALTPLERPSSLQIAAHPLPPRKVDQVSTICPFLTT